MSELSWKACLYLENGQYFVGKGFGSKEAQGGEAVFNTGMTGYQEIFSDPSYAHQIVVMTQTHLGNTGINSEDKESEGLKLKGVVVRDYVSEPSNWRSEMSLAEYLKKAGICGISEIDTRKLTQVLREEGAQRAVIFPLESDSEIISQGKKNLESVSPMEGLDLVSQVSCKSPWDFKDTFGETGQSRGTVVVYDFGVKWNILRSLSQRGFQVKVVPYNLPAEEVLKEKPIAICLSNGPGDPASVPQAVSEIQKLIGQVPILAICMGHQLLARALGGKTYKLKYGHHGVNHPVKDLDSGRIMITSQNHGFAVDADSLSQKEVKINLLNLNDQTVEGFRSDQLKLSSIQFHPESKPGPNDAQVLFDDFIMRCVL